jgi:hypothetical protein
VPLATMAAGLALVAAFCWYALRAAHPAAQHPAAPQARRNPEPAAARR